MATWNRITEREYWDALEVLPPALHGNGGFLIGEPTDHVAEGPRFGAYLARNGAWWHLSEPITRTQMREVLKGALAFPFSDVEPPSDKARALATHFSVSPDEIEVTRYDADTFTVESEPGEYRVLTDSEADEAWSDYQDNLIDETILAQCPDEVRRYFDYAAYKRDVGLNQGRGPALAGYDGEEHEIKFGDTWFYIYRVG